MTSPANLEVEVHLEDGGAPQSIARDVRDGLSASPKQLPSKYFYDERGSRLFQQITEQPEYYLTRAETALLRRSARAIATLTRVRELIELGAGAAEKTQLLIEAAIAQGTLERYVPVEISEDFVRRSAEAIASRYPQIDVHALVGDFEAHLGKVPDGGHRVIALLGSTIGNFTDDDAVALLRKVRGLMLDGDWFLLGTDLVKDPARIEAAYNDAKGVTAEFNRNILNVINHHVDGDFDPAAFDHVSRYNQPRTRIESYLRSRRDQAVRLARLDLNVRFAEGELLRTEISRKYTRQSVQELLSRVDLQLEHWFSDPQATFALSLSRPRPSGA